MALSAAHRVRMRRRAASLQITSTCLAATLACADRTPVEPSAPKSTVTDGATTLPAARLTLDEEFEFIARHEIPGFAGYYIRDGELVVLLKDMSRRTAALNLAAERTAQGLGKLGVERAAVREANFDFVQLAQWQRLLMDQLGNSLNDLLVDIDEVANRILIGYEDEAVGGTVRGIVLTSGIPPLAVAVEHRKLPRQRLTLRDDYSSMQAGIQISESSGDKGACTLGFNVIYNGQPGFVTASHCTRISFAPDGGSFHQVSSRVGEEVWDPYKYKCVWFAKCRWSDAAIIRYDVGVSSDLGLIAWPYPDAYGGPGTVDVGDPPNWYYISTKWTTSIPVGAPATKVGRTSGRTVGNVTQSCVTLSGLYCQYVTDVWSQPGDSGAPFLLSPSGPGAAIAGVLWGGPPQVWTETWFSPMDGIERDLGSSLTVCYPGWGC